MRKITEIESVFEKYGIVHQGNIALFNQTFFLHTDDVQAEAVTNKYVMSRAENTEASATFTHLPGIKEFQKATHMLQYLTKGRGNNLHYHADGDLNKMFYELLQKLGYLDHLFGLNLTVYGTPHKGTDALKIDVPSDIEDPAAFIQKIQELYRETRRHVACLNVSATVEVMRGVDTVYRTVWLLNRLLIAACKGSRDFVPGQVTLFTPYLTQVTTESVEQKIGVVCTRLYNEYRLYAKDETLCQYVFRMSRGSDASSSVIKRRLADSTESARRELCQLLERPLTCDDYNDFVATWVLNNLEESPNHHHRGLYLELREAHEFEGLHMPFLEWVKKTLTESLEANAHNAVTAAWDVHRQRYSDDQGLFIHHLEELHS